MTQVLVLTLSGDDQPGVTAGLTHVLANQPVSIRQLEQIVLQGHLVLGLVLQGHVDSFAQATDVARAYAHSRNMDVAARIIADSDLDLWREQIGRAHV